VNGESLGIWEEETVVFFLFSLRAEKKKPAPQPVSKGTETRTPE
jgi:hypothetical protein